MEEGCPGHRIQASESVASGSAFVVLLPGRPFSRLLGVATGVSTTARCRREEMEARGKMATGMLTGGGTDDERSGILLGG